MSKACIDMGKYRAVIFDLDGVIADAMGLHYLAYLRAFLKYGIYISELDLYRLEGMDTSDLVRTISDGIGAGLTEEQISSLVDDKRSAYPPLAEEGAKIFPGVIETLSMLEGHGIRMALITGTNIRSMQATLKKVNISENRFDVIITSELTPKRKPNPDPYAKCMNDLKIPGKYCLVVENSPLGIVSAKAAGAGHVIGLTTTLPPEYLKCADTIMGSFSELEKCLSRYYGVKNTKL
jgi:beta-phosphoglucomutase